MIRKLCVIGVGLIGGSLARDLKRLDLCEEIVGCSRNQDNLQRAVDLGVIDSFNTEISSAAQGADMVVVAVPLEAMKSVFKELQGALSEHCVVTDVGSSKESVIGAAEEVFGTLPPWFVAGHPIAGAENSGVEACVEGLFVDHRVILTPTSATDPGALKRVSDMWHAVGAEVIEMEPHHHDEVLAATSHLPHMLAYTLVDVLGRMQDRVEIFRYAAGGFRDFTRIASSDPRMWHDVCLANRHAMIGVLEHFAGDLDKLIGAVKTGDGDYLFEMFTRAKSYRDRYNQNGSKDSEKPNDNN